MDRGAWRATVQRVAKSQTRLKRLTQTHRGRDLQRDADNEAVRDKSATDREGGAGFGAKGIAKQGGPPEKWTTERWRAGSGGVRVETN